MVLRVIPQGAAPNIYLRRANMLLRGRIIHTDSDALKVFEKTAG